MNKENNKTGFEARAPEYTTDGVAVWVNKDKNNNKYLSIKIVGHNTINVFKNLNNDKKQG